MLRRFAQTLMHPWWSAGRIAEVHGVLGTRGTITFLFKERLLRVLSWVAGHWFLPTAYRLYARKSRFPLLCRYGTSDRDVFAQVFVEEGYSCVPGRPGGCAPRFIIDCGANVGYASVYFLERFPNTRVLAVEPDPENFLMLCRNLARYGDRAQALHAAVWPRKASLVAVRGRYGDGREWATQVRESDEGEEPDVRAFGVEDLLDRSGFGQIDLLKVDIEGAEVEVFGENYEGWIGKVGAFIIELHDERCREAFFSALKADGSAFRFFESDELMVAERVSAG